MATIPTFDALQGTGKEILLLDWWMFDQGYHKAEEELLWPGNLSMADTDAGAFRVNIEGGQQALIDALPAFVPVSMRLNHTDRFAQPVLGRPTYLGYHYHAAVVVDKGTNYVDLSHPLPSNINHATNHDGSARSGLNLDYDLAYGKGVGSGASAHPAQWTNWAWWQHVFSPDTKRYHYQLNRRLGYFTQLDGGYTVRGSAVVGGASYNLGIGRPSPGRNLTANALYAVTLPGDGDAFLAPAVACLGRRYHAAHTTLVSIDRSGPGTVQAWVEDDTGTRISDVVGTHTAGGLERVVVPYLTSGAGNYRLVLQSVGTGGVSRSLELGEVEYRELRANAMHVLMPWPHEAPTYTMGASTANIASFLFFRDDGRDENAPGCPGLITPEGVHVVVNADAPYTAALTAPHIHNSEGGRDMNNTIIDHADLLPLRESYQWAMVSEGANTIYNWRRNLGFVLTPDIYSQNYQAWLVDAADKTDTLYVVTNNRIGVNDDTGLISDGWSREAVQQDNTPAETYYYDIEGIDYLMADLAVAYTEEAVGGMEPDADILTSAVESTAATTFGVLVDASDSSYVQNTGKANGQAILGVGAPVAPLGLSALSITARARRLRTPESALPTVRSANLAFEYRCDDGAGQVVTDYGPNALHGQLGSTSGAEAGDPVWTAEGLSFDGVDDWAKLPISQVFSFNETGRASTITVAVNTPNVASASVIIGKFNEWGMSLHSASGDFYPRLDLFGYNSGVSPSVTTGAWHTITIAWTVGTGGTIYVDGAAHHSFSTTDTSAYDPATPGSLGASEDTGVLVSLLEGSLAYVVGYDTMLTEAEVQANRLALKDILAPRGIVLP